MPFLLTDQRLKTLRGAEWFPGLPLPFRPVSNGEFTPGPRTPRQRQAEARLRDLAERNARRHGMTTAAYLRTPAGMAGAFAAMNATYGLSFSVGETEPIDLEEAAARRARLAGQFIFDDHVHFLRDDADPAAFGSLKFMLELTGEILKLRDSGAPVLDQVKFANFLKEVFLDSDTKLVMLSGAPSDEPGGWMLTNDQMAAAKATLNGALGETRMLTHAVFAPGHPGWLEEIDRVHETLKPDGWKGYTIGEAFSPSRYRWRMDDESLAYQGYGKMLKAGLVNVCVHKGLVPDNVEEVLPGAEPFARVDDVAKAARDWPDLNFVIYHAGYRTAPYPSEADVRKFEATGRIDWVSDLAEMPARLGVSNIYADIGASFAFTCITHPRLAAGMLGILVKGLGADHVLWGTDSVWFGSPQWQIEAFRRIEVPEDLQEKFGLPALGPADGPVKTAILGGNGARLYGLDPAAYARGPDLGGRLDALQAEYLRRGGGPSNQAFGYVA